MRVAITGRPGVGKTTACLKIYERLRGKKDIRGFVTREVREKGVRVGFEIVELTTNETYVLARKGDGYPRVSKYRVFVENLEIVASRIAGYANADLVILDEVGPMELKSRSFVDAVERLLDSHENLLLTVHYRSTHPLVLRIKREFEVVELTPENRDRVVEEVLERLDS
ncbi:putative nucleotide kinase [Geoglobus ahangari]|uniref:Nucleoside-triphosphatase GAH_00092 n=1 Tax=Geoglobus ahangari TaxID=113653 RepID=A0A0F7IHT1_9EURY|nr:NTPase [Geoglobus ahangari]AKG92548.1 putative nucleotide kinase [Geoglobus ahangari]